MEEPPDLCSLVSPWKSRGTFRSVCAFAAFTAMAALTPDGLGRHPTWQRRGRGVGVGPTRWSARLLPRQGALSTYRPVPQPQVQTHAASALLNVTFPIRRGSLRAGDSAGRSPGCPLQAQQALARRCPGRGARGPRRGLASPVAPRVPAGRPSRTGSVPAARGQPLPRVLRLSPSLSMAPHAPAHFVGFRPSLCQAGAPTVPLLSVPGAPLP